MTEREAVAAAIEAVAEAMTPGNSFETFRQRVYAIAAELREDQPAHEPLRTERAQTAPGKTFGINLVDPADPQE